MVRLSSCHTTGISRWCLVLVVAAMGFVARGQSGYTLTLDEVIALAQSDAPDVLLAETRWKSSYWTYQTYRADLRPQIDLFAQTLPGLNRSIESITLPTGQETFRNRSFMNNDLGISLVQDIPGTGGTIFARTHLRRLDIFKTDAGEGSISYLSTPVSIGISQPLFSYNGMRWRKQIQPLVFEESKKEYSEEMEQVAFEAALLFFDLLISQQNAAAAEIDKANADTLLVLSRGRYEVGKIAEMDLLQIELNAMQAEARLSESQLAMQSNTERLRNFLGLQGAIEFDLVPPFDLPDIIIDAEAALGHAELHRSDMVSYERRIVEAQREVDRARGETGIEMSLNGRFGLTQTGPEFSDAYMDLLDEEVLTLNLAIPLADWGKSKARRAVAESLLQLETQQVEQDRESFKREVILKAQQFELVKRNVEVAQRASDAAHKRYDITYNRYLIGKIGVIDLNLALSDQEAGRRAYVQAVRDFWIALFEIRGLTLYDYVNDRPLIRESPEVE